MKWNKSYNILIKQVTKKDYDFRLRKCVEILLEEAIEQNLTTK